ncbi:hypothetical protein V866_003439 [Kwoniella sp. B9012]
MGSPSDDFDFTALRSEAGPIRVSQRQPASCTECTRRKTRCDKKEPCTNCRTRGVPEKCRIERVIPTKQLNAAANLRLLKNDVQSFKTNVEKRVTDLETLVKGLIAAQSSDELIHGVQGCSTESPIASMSTDQFSDDGSPPGDNDGADAAATLEFLAIGRVRAASPEGLQEDIRWASGMVEEQASQGTHSDSSPSSMTFPLVDPAPSTSISSTPSLNFGLSRSSRPLRQRLSAARQKVRDEIISTLPTPELGKMLVQFDIEHVAWTHCCYHGPTFQSESDLFWSELGVPGVEINWSFLALLLGVIMSAAYHLPPGIFRTLFPGQTPIELVNNWFDASLLCLQEADWMRSHSLKSHRQSGSLFHALGSSSESGARPQPTQAWTRLASTLPVGGCENCHCKRNAFHAAFNGSCSINQAQFNTPPPLHCIDSQLGLGTQQAVVPLDVPTTDSHVSQLYKVALQVNKAYSETDHLSPIQYDNLLEIDHDMQNIRAEAPAWMRDENYPLSPDMPAWVDWQRKAYLLSAAHKVIVLHRPYLGRAIRGDLRYARSRETCLEHAKLILGIFKRCSMPQFRATWTVLVHAVAASLVIILDAAQQTETVVSEGIEMVRETLQILLGMKDVSMIAQKGALVLAALIDRSAQLASTQAGLTGNKNRKDRTGFTGRAETELNRALDIFHRTHLPKSPTPIIMHGLPQTSSLSLETNWLGDFGAFPPSSGIRGQILSQDDTFEAMSQSTGPFDPFFGFSQPEWETLASTALELDDLVVR